MEPTLFGGGGKGGAVRGLVKEDSESQREYFNDPALRQCGKERE
jgi:hypothetical protein